MYKTKVDATVSRELKLKEKIHDSAIWYLEPKRLSRIFFKENTAVMFRLIVQWMDFH